MDTDHVCPRALHQGSAEQRKKESSALTELSSSSRDSKLSENTSKVSSSSFHQDTYYSLTECQQSTTFQLLVSFSTEDRLKDFQATITLEFGIQGVQLC